MTQVLSFGMPVRNGLLCEAPACKELATHQIKFTTGLAGEETLRCEGHLQLFKNTPTYNVLSFVKLKIPGELNPVDPKDISPKKGDGKPLEKKS